MISRYATATAALSRLADAPLLLIRLALGLLFIDHGLQKYHAPGGVASFEYFLKSLKNVPATGLTSQVVPALEVAGGVVLIAGLLTRVIALVLGLEMVYTGFYVKLHDLHTGVVSQRGAGAELDIAYLLVLLVVLVLGPGRASLDALLGLERRRSVAAPVISNHVPQRQPA